MSNPYLIQDTTLTAIADGVRDSLGYGSSSSDPHAGYYPSTSNVPIVSFTTPADTSSYNSTQEYVLFQYVSWSQYETWCGEMPKKVKITRVSSTNYSTKIELGLTSNSQRIPLFTTKAKCPQGSFKIIDIPQDATIFRIYETYTYSGNLSQLKVTFLDSHGHPYVVQNGDTSFQHLTKTVTFDLGSEYSPILLSPGRIANALKQQAFSFEGFFYYSGNSYVNLSGIFSSKQDLLNRLYNICVFGLPGTLLIGVDGHPVSMRREGISLPSNISSGQGGWNPMTNVTTAYDNDQIFCYHFKNPDLQGNLGDTQLAYIYVPPTTDPMIVFCLDSTIGKQLSGSNDKIIMYRGA